MKTLIEIYLSGIVPGFLFTRFMWHKTYPEYKKDFYWTDGVLWLFYSLFSWMAFGAAIISYYTFRDKS